MVAKVGLRPCQCGRTFQVFQRSQGKLMGNPVDNTYYKYPRILGGEERGVKAP